MKILWGSFRNLIPCQNSFHDFLMRFKATTQTLKIKQSKQTKNFLTAQSKERQICDIRAKD